MFRFDKFVEQWAMKYKPMQHVPGPFSKNERFFLTDTYMGMVDFVTTLQPESSPCVVMESDQEGCMTDRYDSPRYTLYFMVRAEKMSDGVAAYEAKLEAKMHMQKFMNWLRAMQEKEEDERRKEGVRNIRIEDNMSYQTVGPFYDGWYGVYISLDDTQAYSRCVISDDYLQD